MKTLLFLFVVSTSSFALADSVVITPGSSITVNAQTTVTCQANNTNSVCDQVGSSDATIQTCSGRAMGSRCAVGSFRGICDLASNVGHSGSSTMCACQ
jgi:hypothetical protein